MGIAALLTGEEDPGTLPVKTVKITSAYEQASYAIQDIHSKWSPSIMSDACHGIRPRYDDLRALLDRIPRRSTAVLTNSRKRP